jgi:hypothetical protein
MAERKTARRGSGQKAKPKPGKDLPKPDWDSGDLLLTPLPPPGNPPQWHTLHHNLNSMNLLVDAKLGGVNAQGEVAWSLSTETLFALPDSNTLTFRWNLDQDVWNYYSSTFGWTGQPRLRVRIWRW